MLLDEDCAIVCLFSFCLISSDIVLLIGGMLMTGVGLRTVDVLSA